MQRRRFLQLLGTAAIVVAMPKTAVAISLSPSSYKDEVVRTVKHSTRFTRQQRVHAENLRQTLFAKDSRIYQHYFRAQSDIHLVAILDRPALLFASDLTAQIYAEKYNFPCVEGRLVFARYDYWTQ